MHNSSVRPCGSIPVACNVERKKDSPPIEIHSIRGSHPCDCQSRHYQCKCASQRRCSCMALPDTRLQDTKMLLPPSSTDLEEGSPALLAPDLHGAVADVVVGAAGALSHQPRLQHVERRRQDASDGTCSRACKQKAINIGRLRVGLVPRGRCPSYIAGLILPHPDIRR